MVKICNYSSLIFAGNVTVLLIVSMTTDYWEYRGFNSTLLNSTLHKIKNAEIMVPRDTKSYIQVWYKRKHIDRVDNEEEEPLLHQETLYQPPIFVSNFFKNDKTHLQQKKSSVITSNLEGGMVVLFQQYGNLFRDCDALEGKPHHHIFFISSPVHLLCKLLIIKCYCVVLACVVIHVCDSLW
jgi:hypothetical protein